MTWWLNWLASAAVSSAAPATPPWWGVPLLSGGFLVVGAVLGFLFNWLIERRKFRQTETVRWKSEIRQLVAEMIALADSTQKRAGARMGYIDGIRAVAEWALGHLDENAIREVMGDSRDVDSFLHRRLQESDAGKFFAEIRAEQAMDSERLWAVTAGLDLIAPAAIRTQVHLFDVGIRALADQVEGRSDSHSMEPSESLSVARERLVSSVRKHLTLRG